MDQQEIVLNFIERNAFFAHPENMMISLLANEDVAQRRKALQIDKNIIRRRLK